MDKERTGAVEGGIS